MTDELPASEHQTLASSKYAKLIFYLSAVLLLGMIAADRQRASKVSLRDELIQRLFHAERMEERAIRFLEGSRLPLLNICYAALAGSGPPCQISESDGQLDVGLPDSVPVGILGNYSARTDSQPPENRWGIPDPEVLKVLDEFVTQVSPLILQGSSTDIEKHTRAAVNTLIEHSVLTAWRKSFPNETDLGKPVDFLRLTMSMAEQAVGRKLSTDAARANVAGSLKYLWGKGEKTSMDSAAAEAVIRRTFGPAQAEEIISSSETWVFKGDVETFAGLLIRSSKPELLKEEVSWLVTGAVSHLGLDHEHNAESLGLGYVDKPNAASDLPVFSVAEFVATTPEKTLERIKSYQVDIEKMLMTKALSESPIEIFGTGIGLSLSDLVIMAGILIAVMQMLYVITVGQEESVLPGHPTSYTPFPRFSSSRDPAKDEIPSTAEQWFERIIYGAFLVVPTALVFLGWLSGFKLSNALYLVAHPLDAWGAKIDFVQLAKSAATTGFASSVYACAIAASAYSLHRSVIDQETRSKRGHWSRLGVLWRAGAATACFALLIGLNGANEYFVGCFIYAGASVLLYLYEDSDKWRKWAKQIGIVFLASVIVVTLASIFVEWLRSWPWRPAYFVLPFGGNVLFPIMICWCGLFAAFRRNLRLPFWFFVCWAGILSVVVLQPFLGLLSSLVSYLQDAGSVTVEKMPF